MVERSRAMSFAFFTMSFVRVPSLGRLVGAFVVVVFSSKVHAGLLRSTHFLGAAFFLADDVRRAASLDRPIEISAGEVTQGARNAAQRRTSIGDWTEPSRAIRLNLNDAHPAHDLFGDLVVSARDEARPLGALGVVGAKVAAASFRVALEIDPTVPVEVTVGCVRAEHPA